MRYWVTTHWPRDEGDDSPQEGVYLKDEDREAGQDLGIGDRVVIYESKSGKRRMRTEPGTAGKIAVRCRAGAGAVVVIVEVIGDLGTNPRATPTEYDNGKVRFWRWYAPTKVVNKSGFVTRQRLTELLGYEPGFPYRGLGTKHSGLKQIDKDTYEAIVTEFVKNCSRKCRPRTNRNTRPRRPVRRGGTGEGPEHLALKERVAKDPAKVLGEPGLRHIETEYEFITNDRADLILGDRDGRYVGVEVEVDVAAGDICGVLQAVKYKHMYAVVCNRPYEEVRAFLVAHSIAPSVRSLCETYGVEWFEVKR